MPFATRIRTLQERLRKRKLDAVLIGQPHNRRYISGYTAVDHSIQESSGLLLVPRRGIPHLLTDFRFRQQAVAEARGVEVTLHRKGPIHLLQTLLPDLGITALAFESDYTLHSTAERLSALGEKLSISVTPVAGLVEMMRCIKDEEEIDSIRRAVRLNETVFKKIYHSLSPAKSEVDVALEIAAEMRRAGAEGESFSSIVATGMASSLPHAVPGKQKLLKNQPLLIDMGLVLDGYCSDMTRTICLGKPDRKFREIHRIVRKAQVAGIKAVQAGITGREVDRAARKVIAEAGYGKSFGHALGHGVGMAVHEIPRVSPGAARKLKAGMVITIEPGIYLPGWGGIRLENMVVVREGGCEILNSDTTELDI